MAFLDESGVKTNMTRLYGRSLHGKRCHDSAPCGHWETVTVLSSIRLDGATECIVFEGTAYIKEILSPSPRPGDIVVKDNLSAHKSHQS
ncbi:MAG: transposase [Desulfovibrio sp.]|nr:transposase [Desulfovibrio sp.]